MDIKKIGDKIQFSFRGSLALILVIGATTIAIIDANFRGYYKEICILGLGGYFAQLTPKRQEEADPAQKNYDQDTQ